MFFIYIFSESPRIESHWLELDHMTIPKPITLTRGSSRGPWLGHMTAPEIRWGVGSGGQFH